VQNSLIDAGPIIALFDNDDKYHDNVLTFIKDFKGKLFTSWPVITEVSYFLNFNVNVQIDFYKWIQKNAVQIINLTNENIQRIIELTKKYSDLPMDLADGSLLLISEMLGIKHIITIDSEYYVYRTHDKRMLNNLLEKYL
jgi:uncharacterized protein